MTLDEPCTSMGMIGKHRTTLHEAKGRICFAPAIVDHEGRRVLIFSEGAAAHRTFVPRTHPWREPELWYTGGRNRIRVANSVADGGRLNLGSTLPMPAGTDDAMGASLFSASSGLHLWFGARSLAGPWHIYRSMSRDGGRSWSEPVPALKPGPAGSSDCEHVLMPAVLKRDDGWWMWYAGRDGGHRRIHLARSEDGLRWTKHGVVLDLGDLGSCDEYATDCPSVCETPDGGLVMLYGAGSSRSIAAAVSRDGITWTRLGPVLHREAAGGADSRYAFYPALLATSSGTAELFYAGEDESGRWRLRTAGRIDLRRLSERRAELRIGSAQAHALDSALEYVHRDVPQEYLAEPVDCHGPAPAYSSPDGRIRQLRPSSTPVFKITAKEPGLAALVVKLGRGRRAVEREFDGIQTLAEHFPTLPATLHYRGEKAALVTPFLAGVSLASLAERDPDSFAEVLSDVVARLASAAKATMTTAATSSCIDHTCQTPTVLAEWLGDISSALAPWSDHPLSLNGAPLGLTINQAIGRARQLIGAPAARLIHVGGDLHLGNVRVAEDHKRWWLLDVEFAGLHDLDQCLASLLCSLLKHSGLVVAANAEVADGKIDLRPRLRSDPAAEILTTSWFVDRFADLDFNPGRVFSFVLADLRFRLVGEPPNRPPAFGLAALALAAEITGAAALI